mmetsp:Transcript_66328/g.181913  ORF Transcript_66328/g.181913 Transcript_66328/m.181913 type:complete len:214 (+) Transcript_66328:770-1411(+)
MSCASPTHPRRRRPVSCRCSRTSGRWVTAPTPPRRPPSWRPTPLSRRSLLQASAEALSRAAKSSRDGAATLPFVLRCASAPERRGACDGLVTRRALPDGGAWPTWGVTEPPAACPYSRGIRRRASPGCLYLFLPARMIDHGCLLGGLLSTAIGHHRHGGIPSPSPPPLPLLPTEHSERGAQAGWLAERVPLHTDLLAVLRRLVAVVSPYVAEV